MPSVVATIADVRRAFAPLIPDALAGRPDLAEPKLPHYFVPDCRQCDLADLHRLIFNLRHQTSHNWRLVLGSVDEATNLVLAGLVSNDRRIIHQPTSRHEDISRLYAGTYSPPRPGALELDPLGAIRALPADATVALIRADELPSPSWTRTVCSLMQDKPPSPLLRSGLMAASSDRILGQNIDALLAAHPDRTAFSFTPQELDTLIRGMARTSPLDKAIEPFTSRITRGEHAYWVVDDPAFWNLAGPIVNIRGWCLQRDLQPVRALIWTLPGGLRQVIVPNESRGDVLSVFQAPQASRQCGFKFAVELLLPTGSIRLEADLTDGRRVTLGELPYRCTCPPANWVGAWLFLGASDQPPPGADETSAGELQLHALPRHTPPVASDRLARDVGSIIDASPGEWVMFVEPGFKFHDDADCSIPITTDAKVGIYCGTKLVGPGDDAFLAADNLLSADLEQLSRCTQQLTATEVHHASHVFSVVRKSAWRNASKLISHRITSWPQLLAELAQTLTRQGWQIQQRPEWMLVPIAATGHESARVREHTSTLR